MIETLILAGKFLSHLRGAWVCGCKLAVIVNETVGEGIDLDLDTGFEL